MSDLSQVLHQHLLSSPLLAFGAAFAGGMLTSFEPCIYTMLPVTVTFIGSQSGGSKLKGFFLSVVYVLGMALTYSILGAVAALTRTLFGEVSRSPWVNLAMGNICIILGLSMFDLFIIRMPSALSNLQSRKIGKGFVTIFFLGIFSGFVVGPCTAAVLGVLLSYVAMKQNIILGSALLFTFSFGMGIIVIIVGTFAGALMALPKPGPWMEKLRRLMGVILIGIGEYFIFIAGTLAQ